MADIKFLDTIKKFFSPNEFSYLISAIIILLVAIIATTSIIEISRRQQFIGFLKRKTNELEAKNLTLYQELSRVQQAYYLETLSNSKVTNPSETTFNREEDLYDEMKITRSRIDSLEADVRNYTELSYLVISLYRDGASKESETLRALLVRERYLANVVSLETQSSSEVKTYSDTLNNLGLNILNTKILNADYLIALIIVSCTVLGSMITNFRTAKRISMRNLALGIGTGFITFLAIKGGKSVFLLEFYQQEPIPLNPYSIAFAGILAGLFTDRLFTLLSMLVDKMSQQLLNAFDGGGKT